MCYTSTYILPTNLPTDLEKSAALGDAASKCDSWDAYG